MLSPAQLLSLAKLGPLKIADLTAEHILDVGKTMGITMSPEIVREVAQLLKQDDADTLADWIGRPDNLQRLRDTVSPPSAGPEVVKCPHCSKVFCLDQE